MRTYPKSNRILERNRRVIPGGMFSINRETEPGIVFTKGEGALLWDADGNRYIDYHGAFAPFLLGHNHPEVNAAVEQVLRNGTSLFGVNTTTLEGDLAELICEAVPFADQVCVLNTGSEATYQAIRAARAYTSRDHIIVMQGGYNGWHNDVACNLMTPIEEIGPRYSPGEYPFVPIGAGIPAAHRELVHPINFNDLGSVEYVARRYPVAGLIAEPILQNIGIVKPQPDYLAGLRRLADQYGFVLIFDEVKTGFRHGLGGYAALAGVSPDLAVYGKAIANGYPIAALVGRREIMELFGHPNHRRRVLLAGTYNGHPVPLAAAIATIRILRAGGGAVYHHLDQLGQRIEEAFAGVAADCAMPLTLVRQGSAFCIYFMDHAPVDWHDIAAHHDFNADVRMRRWMIEQGVFLFPVATKQCSISAAHTESLIDETVSHLPQALAQAAQAVAL
ncbi:MAG TPA: aspartate aminotransferase family protein [Bryobacteraceae bacterium]|nr:aspartate aminotransferase family protein [Bryobacteraceae bacterium]